MTKRKLVGQELVISMKSLERMKEEMEYNKYQYDICELKLKTGLMVEHLKQVRDYKQLKKEFAEQLKMVEKNK